MTKFYTDLRIEVSREEETKRLRFAVFGRHVMSIGSKLQLSPWLRSYDKANDIKEQMEKEDA